jgi:hypothetical protein
MKDGRLVRSRAALAVLGVVLAAICINSVAAQKHDAFTTSGVIAADGATRPYVVRHLPVSSFPALPTAVAAELNRRDCLIPQTYEAHGPENVIHGSFKRAASNDWAALCSVHGTVTLLVFFEGEEQSPAVLSSAAETARLEWNGASGKMEFDWGIDTATPELVHEAQTGMRRRPAKLDHDAIASSIINSETLYRFYSGMAWTLVDTRD